MPSRRSAGARPRCVSAAMSAEGAARGGARRCRSRSPGQAQLSADCRRARAGAGAGHLAGRGIAAPAAILRPSAQPVLADPVCFVRRERQRPTIPTRLAFVAGRRVALWDVCMAGEREASADATIRREMPNAIDRLLDAYPLIGAVAFNGSGARRLYDRHFRAPARTWSIWRCRRPARPMRASISPRSSRNGPRCGRRWTGTLSQRVGGAQSFLLKNRAIRRRLRKQSRRNSVRGLLLTQIRQRVMPNVKATPPRRPTHSGIAFYRC